MLDLRNSRHNFMLIMSLLYGDCEHEGHNELDKPCDGYVNLVHSFFQHPYVRQRFQRNQEVSRRTRCVIVKQCYDWTIQTFYVITKIIVLLFTKKLHEKSYLSSGRQIGFLKWECPFDFIIFFLGESDVYVNINDALTMSVTESMKSVSKPPLIPGKSSPTCEILRREFGKSHTTSKSSNTPMVRCS